MLSGWRWSLLHSDSSASKYMKQSSWKSDTRPASQEIIHLLQNTNVHCCVHNSPQLRPYTGTHKPGQTLTQCFIKIPSNIIVLLILKSLKCSFQVFRLQFCIHFSSSRTYWSCRPSHHFVLIRNSTSCFVWMWNLVSNFKGRA
jgi:hypothetical protein